MKGIGGLSKGFFIALLCRALLGNLATGIVPGRAPVAQRIEHWPPEPEAWVRVPPGVLLAPRVRRSRCAEPEIPYFNTVPGMNSWSHTLAGEVSWEGDTRLPQAIE